MPHTINAILAFGFISSIIISTISGQPACGDEACVDSNMSFSVGSGGATYDCVTLVASFPMLCAPDHAHSVAEQCCQTCCTSSCIDSDRPVRVRGEDMSCAEMVKLDPYYCKMPQFLDASFTQCCAACAPYRDICLDSTQSVPLANNEIDLGCAELVDKWPIYCKDAQLAGENGLCCATCADVDVDCVDAIGAVFTLEGTQVTCADIKQGYVHFCNNADVQEKCCLSCKEVLDVKKLIEGGKSISDDDKQLVCRDTVMEFPLYKDGPLVTCANIANEYQVYCQYPFYSAPMGRCCHTCSNIDLTCVDYPESVLPVLDDIGIQVSCATLAQEYPYYCKMLGGQVKSGNSNYCCASCSLVEYACLDKPGKSIPRPDTGALVSCQDLHKLPVMCLTYGGECCESCSQINTTCTDVLGKGVETEDMKKPLTCSDVAKRYPYYCSTDDIGGAGGSCCVTCQSVETVCTDKPGKWIPLEGTRKLYQCSDAKRYPYICTLFADDCCTTCAEIDTTCTDKPFKVIQVDSPDKRPVIATCQNVAEHFAYHCLEEEISADGGLCCESCKYANTTCSNLAGSHLSIPGQADLYSCKDAVEDFVNVCTLEAVAGPGGSCCKQCQAVTAEDLACADSLTFNASAYDGGMFMGCSGLVSAFGGFCSPNMTDQTVAENCCHSCAEKYDPQCANNPEYEITIRIPGEGRCRRCHCDQFRQKSRNALKVACCSLEEQTEEIRANCCQTCADVKCE